MPYAESGGKMNILESLTNNESMIWWIVAIGLGDLIASPARILLEEFVKEFMNKKFGLFKGHKAIVDLHDTVEKLLLKQSKKRGYKKKATQALQVIKEAINEENKNNENK
jgi:hypothetical protein